MYLKNAPLPNLPQQSKKPLTFLKSYANISKKKCKTVFSSITNKTHKLINCCLSKEIVRKFLDKQQN